MDGFSNAILPNAVATASNTLIDLLPCSGLYIHISRLLKDCLDLVGTATFHARHEARLGSVQCGHRGHHNVDACICSASLS
jgi:hypothetical protein